MTTRPIEAPPLELKKTINLPQTKFAQKANLPQTEPARLKKWSEMKLYERIREARAGAEKFILHDGAPYAHADIHLCTGPNKIHNDIVLQPRNMTSHYAPYVPCYDSHGFPTHSPAVLKLGAITTYTTAGLRP